MKAHKFSGLRQVIHIKNRVVAALYFSQSTLSRLYEEEVSYMVSKKLLYTCVLTLAAILLVLSGCASNSGTSSGSSTLKAGPGVDVNNKTITLGILSPYTGPVADPIGIP